MAFVSIQFNDTSTDGPVTGANVPTALAAGPSGASTLRMLGEYLRSKALVGVGAGRLVTSSTDSVRAVGTLTLSGNPSNNETMVLGAQTITAKTSGATGLQFNIGGTAAATAINIAALINTNTTLNAFLSATSTSSTVVITSLFAGVLGNQIPFTESMTNVTADGSGFLGGTTAGAGGTNTTVAAFSVGTASTL